LVLVGRFLREQASWDVAIQTTLYEQEAGQAPPCDRTAAVCRPVG